MVRGKPSAGGRCLSKRSGRVIRLTGVALVTGCASAHVVPTPGTARLIPFTATSLRSVYGIQGRFEGTATLRDGWLYVAVPTGAVKTFQLDPQQYWDLRLRVGLMSCDTVPGGSTAQVVSESRAVRLAPPLGIIEQSGAIDTTTHVLKEPLRFDLGVPPGTHLDRSWLVLIFEWPFANALATYELQTDAALGEEGKGPRRVVPPGRDPKFFTFSCR